MDHPVACSIGGGTLSGVLRIGALAFCLVNEMSLSRGYLYLADLSAQSPCWSYHCVRDYVGLNFILTNSYEVQFYLSVLFHIPSLTMQSDEFSGFVESEKLFRDFSRLAAGKWLCS